MQNIRNYTMDVYQLYNISGIVAGEHMASAISVDFCKWVHEFGSGSVRLVVRRPVTGGVYSPNLLIIENTAIWILTRNDTADEGVIHAQLVYDADIGARKKSGIFHVTVR